MMSQNRAADYDRLQARMTFALIWSLNGEIRLLHTKIDHMVQQDQTDLLKFSCKPNCWCPWESDPIASRTESRKNEGGGENVANISKSFRNTHNLLKEENNV